MSRVRPTVEVSRRPLRATIIRTVEIESTIEETEHAVHSLGNVIGEMIDAHINAGDYLAEIHVKFDSFTPRP